MYTVLIADDEMIERTVLKKILSESFSDVCVAAETANGKEAVRLAYELKPDIIIIDIRMPGINGIEAAKRIKQELPETHIVVVTAYDNFEFVQEALSIGVDDYMLKPSKKETIIQVVKKIISKIEDEKKEREKAETVSRKSDEMKQIVENQLISSVMSDNTSETEYFADRLSLDISKGFVLLLNLDEQVTRNSKEHDKAMFGKIYRAVAESFDKKFRYIVSKPIARSIIFIFPLDIIYADISKMYALTVAMELRKITYDVSHKNVSMGIGGFFTEINSISKSYKEAFLALKTAMTDKKTVHYSDMDYKSMKQSLKYPVQKENALVEAVTLGIKEKTENAVDDIFSWIFINLGEDTSLINNYLLGLIGVLIKDLNENGTINAKVFNYRDYLSFNVYTDIWNIKEGFKKIIQEIVAGDAETETEGDLTHIIKTAKKYIKESYDKDISLVELAKLVLLSPQYLSKIFKKETGMTFIDYLTAVRIDKAKEYLQTSQMSIKEISSGVGFKDPNYFFKVFKKTTDMTPREYRNLYMNRVNV